MNSRNTINTRRAELRHSTAAVDHTGSPDTGRPGSLDTCDDGLAADMGCGHSGCWHPARPRAGRDHDCCGSPHHGIIHAVWAREGREDTPQDRILDAIATGLSYAIAPVINELVIAARSWARRRS